MRKMQEMFVLSAVLSAVLPLGAKTLALWPIDYALDDGDMTIRCATDPAYDLTAMKSLSVAFGGDTLPWNLPPNPDPSALLFKPYTYVSLMSDSGEGYLRAQLPSSMLVPNSTYTIEGFVKFTGTGNLGTGAAWVILVNVDGRLQFRMSVDGDVYRLHVWAPNPTTGTNLDANFTGRAFTAAELRDGKWHHWAYTQLPNDGNGHRVYEAFWDGKSVGTLQDGAITTTHSNTGVFMLGTRGANGNTIKGGMEYVRISDTVLKPDEFLNAGGSGTVVIPEATKTAAYWRLGRDANGGVDGANLLGGAPFVRSYYTMSDRACAFTADPEGAFEGQPPNTTVTLAGGNRGSFAAGDGVHAAMSFPALGSALTAGKDFTIETYLRPDHRQMDITGSRALFGTLQVGRQDGWALMLCTNPRTSANWGRRFRLLAGDGQGMIHNHADIGASVPDWDGQWKHVALVHHATGGSAGFGYWEIFLDGVSHASIADARQLGDAEVSSFILGACGGQQSALAKFDCLRVTGAALQSNQFLCADGGQAATGVLAFFPLDLDAKGSAYSVFADVVGSYGQGETATADNFKVVAQTDEPTVTRPDATAGLFASPAEGSLGFAGYGGAKAHLYTMDAAALGVLNSPGREYTIEFYLKHDGISSTCRILLASLQMFTSDWPGLDLHLSYGSNGFIVSDPSVVQGDAFKDQETGVKISSDEWHHVALVCSVVDSEACEYGVGNWKLYVDGKVRFDSDSLGTVFKLRSARGTMQGIEIGDRHWGGNAAIPGKIAHLRISGAALDPSEFLCADAPAPETAATAAYWPLDFRDGRLDLGDRIDASGDFVPDMAVGSRERAIWKAAVATIPAEAERDVGSTVLTGNARLFSAEVADPIGNLTRPFTVEGYVKPSARPTAREVVCGTYRNGRGWKLVLDGTGANPVFRIVGSGRLPTSAFADAAFGAVAADFAGTWHHLALSYDPTGAGVWKLYVDGTLFGSVRNRWNPLGIDIRQPAFHLGADVGDGDASFAGNVDFWRISTGVRAVSEFLYPGAPLPGMTLIFR